MITLKSSNMFNRFSIGALMFFLMLLSCDKSMNNSADAGTGTGGSMARFTIVGNYLYVVDYSNLEVYDISNGYALKKGSIFIGFTIETIFPYNDKLFIGSRDGMFIYSLQDPKRPAKIGAARHLRSCDPVVANDSVSYVTLRSGQACGVVTDGLYIYDIKDITNPKLLKLMELSTPYGLGVKDSVVFVCRDAAGLTAVNVKNPSNPKELYTIKDGEFIDVIPYENLLICYVKSGLMLYDISNPGRIMKVADLMY